ncbi:hypothetical protein ACN091_10570, partial [Aliarcobacter butzleri]|uniref:Kae1-like domain-containing protein n=1 Tax=Aliarcobacter butzleri TaxID=28197 RepID=UPI003AEBAF07
MGITPMIRQIIEDTDKKVISSKFINTLVNLIIEVSTKHKKLPVVFSGGVSLNKTE